MSANETSLAKRVALQAFSESLTKASVALAEAKEAFRAAQEYHQTLTKLIKELHEEGVTLQASVPQRQQATEETLVPALSVANTTPTPVSRKKLVGKKTRKVNVRELITNLITADNAVVQTKEILAKVRVTEGKDFPASTVSAALAQLVKDTTLHRVRDDKSNTSYYGLPEWFDGDVTKPEHVSGF